MDAADRTALEWCIALQYIPADCPVCGDTIATLETFKRARFGYRPDIVHAQCWRKYHMAKTTNLQELIRRVQKIAPLPHTVAEPIGDRVVIVGSNGRVLGWVATTSGDWKAVAELWTLAPTVIDALVRRIEELEGGDRQ